MLVLDRKTEEGFWIGDHIFVKILGIRPQRVKLGIKAASDLEIAREEIRPRSDGQARAETGRDGQEKEGSVDRRRLREALHRSEAENQALLDAIPDMIFRLSSEGRFLGFVPAKGQEPAVPPAQFLGRTLQEVFPADPALEAMAHIERALQTGDTQIFEFRLPVPLPSGNVRDYEARVVATSRDEVLIIARDITERKRTEKTLRETQEHLHAVVSNAPIILWAMDRDGVCTLSEGKGLEALGLKPGEVVGQSVFDLYADEPHILENDRRALAGEEVRSIVEVGGVVFKSLHHPVRDERGQVTQVIGVATDITEHKQAEEILRIHHDLAAELTAADDLDETLRLCLEAAIRASGLDSGCIYLADRSSGAFDLACHEGLGDRYVKAVARHEADSVNARTVMAGKPFYNRYDRLGLITNEPRRREGLRAIAVVPVQHEGEVIACLCVTSHSVDDVPAASQVALETIAAQVGSAIAHTTAHQALRESEQRLRTLVENAPVILFAIDSEGVFTAAEGRGMTPVGLTPDQHVGRSVFDVYSNTPGVTDAARRALAGEAFSETVETEIRVFEAHVTPVRDSEGTITGAVAVATEVTKRRRAEEAAKESEAKWRSLVENAPALILTLDRDGTIQFGNHGVTGAPLEEALGSSIFKYAPPQYHDDMREVFARVFETGEIGGDFDVPWQESDGSTSWHSARVGPLKRDAEVVALTIIATDVTERKRAEEALRESEQRFRTLSEGTLEGIIIDDNVVCLDANPQVAAMAGCELHEFIGGHPLSFVAPESRDLVREHVTSAHEDFIEAVALRKDGTPFPIEVRGKAAFYQGREVRVSVVRDLTERKQAEEALHERERRLRTVVENAPVGLFAIDGEGVITLSEGKAQEAMGLKPGEHVGLSMFEVYRDFPEIVEGTPRVLAGEAMTATIRVGRVLLEVRTTPVRDQDGKVTGAIGVATDITERDRAEKARRESEEHLRTVVTNAPVILFAIDSEGVFTVAEGRGMTPVGLRPDEHVGHSIFDVYRNLPGVIDAARRALAGEAFSETVVTENRVFEAHVTPIRDTSGMITGAVAVATDVTERHQAEEALRNREYVLREVQGIAHVGSWDIDLLTGQESLSDEMYAIYGIDKGADTQIESIMALVHPDDEKAVRQASEDALEGNPPSWEYRIVRPDGEIRTVFTEGARIIRDQASRPVRLIGSTQDITDRKQAEQALHESEGRFRRLAEATLDGIAIHDGGVVLDANQQVADMLGCELLEIIGANLFSYFAPESHELVRQNAESGNEEPYEAVGLRKDGTTFPIELRAKTASYQGRKVRMGAVRDITERKRAEEELRASEEMWRSLVEKSPDIIMNVGPDGTILLVNRTLPGFPPPEQVVGTTVYEFIPPQDHETMRRALERAFQTGEPDSFETAGGGPHGTTSYYETRVAPVKHDGEVASVHLIATDVTELRRAEEALQRARDELEARVERQMQRGGAHGLSFRELTVLHLVVTGRADKEIATELGISPRTASKHVENILEKMGAASRTEASVRAIQEGLVGQPD